jgi:hypothetical protein
VVGVNMSSLVGGSTERVAVALTVVTPGTELLSTTGQEPVEPTVAVNITRVPYTPDGGKALRDVVVGACWTCSWSACEQIRIYWRRCWSAAS